MTLGWPWPILRQGQHRSPVHLNGESCQNVIWGEKLAGNGQMDRHYENSSEFSQAVKIEKKKKISRKLLIFFLILLKPYIVDTR